MMIKAADTTGVRRVLGFAETSDEVEAHMNVPQLEAYINYLLTKVHEDDTRLVSWVEPLHEQCELK